MEINPNRPTGSLKEMGIAKISETTSHILDILESYNLATIGIKEDHDSLVSVTIRFKDNTATKNPTFARKIIDAALSEIERKTSLNLKEAKCFLINDTDYPYFNYTRPSTPTLERT